MNQIIVFFYINLCILLQNNHSPEDSRRYSCGNLYSSMRRSSMCPTRITEIPVENMVNQTKLETLEWQLKEVSTYFTAFNLTQSFFER